MTTRNTSRKSEYHSEWVSGEGNLTAPLKDESSDQDHSVVVGRIASSFCRSDGFEGTLYKDIRIVGFQAIHLWNSIMNNSKWNNSATFRQGPRLVYNNAKMEGYSDKWSSELVPQLTIDSDCSSIGLSLRYSPAEPVARDGEHSVVEEHEPPKRKRRAEKPDADTETDQEASDEQPTPRRKMRRRTPDDVQEEPQEETAPAEPVREQRRQTTRSNYRARRSSNVELRGEPEITSMEDFA